MDHLITLFKKELIMLRNNYLQQKKRFPASLAIVIFRPLIIAFLVQVFVLAFRKLPVDITPQNVAPLLYLSLLVLFITIFLSVFAESGNRFYRSPELDLLIPTPLPAYTLFIFHFVRIIFFSSSTLMTMALFGLPPLLALGIVTGAPWYFYLFLLPMSMLLLIIPASLAAILTMVLALVYPINRGRWALALNFLVMGAWIMFLIYGPEKILPGVMEDMEAYQSLYMSIFPLKDSSLVMGNLLQGMILPAVTPLARLIFISCLTLLGATIVAQKFYYGGYESTREGLKILGDERIYLRTAQETDVQHIYRWWNDPRNFPATGLENQISLEKVLCRLKNSLSSGSEIWFAICSKRQHNPLGLIIAAPEYPEKDLLSIGSIIIDRKYKGRGIGKKAVARFEKWARQNYPNLTLSLGVLENFPGAKSFWESCGFTHIDTVETQYYHNGKKQRAFRFKKKLL